MYFLISYSGKIIVLFMFFTLANLLSMEAQSRSKTMIISFLFLHR
jgi:hypothetical protein